MSVPPRAPNVFSVFRPARHAPTPSAPAIASAAGRSVERALDCLIIGAGPAGLMAAVYLRRYRRNLVIVDAGASRAALIPTTRNFPGMKDGISGDTLLRQMRQQLAAYGQGVLKGTVTAVERATAPADSADTAHEIGGALEDPMFRVRLLPVDAPIDAPIDAAANQSAAEQTWWARRVLLATGIDDALPDIDGLQAAIHTTGVRLCPICDGYEIAGLRTAVYGPAGRALAHARFLRTFAQQVTVLAEDLETLDGDARAEAAQLGIALIAVRPSALYLDAAGNIAIRERPDLGGFDTFYPVMGSHGRADPVALLDPARDNDGTVVTDKHQRTSVTGLFAAGDVVNTLNQITVAVGEGAIAATTIHNSLPLNPLVETAAAAGAASHHRDVPPPHRYR